MAADLRPLSVRQPWLHLTSLRRPAKPTGISCYTEAVPYGDISVPPVQPLHPFPPSLPPPLHLGQYHRGKSKGGVGPRFAPTCQGSTTKRAEPSLRMPGGQVLPYCTAFTWPRCLPAPAPLGEPRHGENPNREELSVAHLGMINLSYVANKGELSVALFSWGNLNLPALMNC